MPFSPSSTATEGPLMRIERLQLTSFKGFSDFTVSLGQVATLVGLNSAGKTSVLQAVKLVHDIVVFAFGGGDRPDFSAPQWTANPSSAIQRVSYADPDAVWLGKRTSEPCSINAIFTGGVEVRLDIIGPRQYKLNVSKNGDSLVGDLPSQVLKEAIEGIFSMRPIFVPSVGETSPLEKLPSYAELRSKFDEGSVSHVWRSYLFWLYNDGNKDEFEQVVSLVGQYLPGAKVLPPQLAHDNPPRVMLQFVEEGAVFDISMSGGGLRTLLNLAVMLRLSGSRCLLLDEPDAHLHSSLQRAVAALLTDYAEENDLQILIASHAPDFISELPVESLVWIDRTQKKGLTCNEVGRLLVDLGAMTKADAIRSCGADRVLFVEGSFDIAVLRELLSLSAGQNPCDDPQVIVAKLPSGGGSAAHLRAFEAMSRSALRLPIKVACIKDKDYDILEGEVSEATEGSDPLLLVLPRKEIENYLVEPSVLASAAGDAARKRTDRTGADVSVPTQADLATELQDILNRVAIREQVRWQVIHRYRDSLEGDLDGSTKEKKADEWFQAQWSDPKWRLAHCPGKAVLKEVRDWCQQHYSLTLTKRCLLDALSGPPADFHGIARQLQVHFYGQ